MHPYVEYDDAYTIGLVNCHYVIHDYTELTFYCLEDYEDVKDLNDSNTIRTKTSK